MDLGRAVASKFLVIRPFVTMRAKFFSATPTLYLEQDVFSMLN